MSETSFPATYHSKRDEETAFRDYADFRYGKVEQDVHAMARIAAHRKGLDPILVDIVDGGIEGTKHRLRRLYRHRHHHAHPR